MEPGAGVALRFRESGMVPGMRSESGSALLRSASAEEAVHRSIIIREEDRVL